VTLGASFAGGIYPGGSRNVTFTAGNPNTHAVPDRHGVGPPGVTRRDTR
jgi:hypothetical protein